MINNNKLIWKNILYNKSQDDPYINFNFNIFEFYFYYYVIIN